MMRCGGVVLPEAVHTCLQLFTPGCNCSDSFRREGARSMRMGAELSVTLVLGGGGGGCAAHAGLLPRGSLTLSRSLPTWRGLKPPLLPTC